jgi:non-ribosomal peptide synthetase component F
LLDGWSLPIVTQDVVRAYAAITNGILPRFEPAVPYRTYIGWLRRQDVQDAELFWRAALRGVTRATPLPLSPPSPAPEGARPLQRSVRVSVGARQTAALKTWARARHVTLNTVIQALWSIVSSLLSGQRYVLFGSVVSGRPSSVSGIDRSVGLFINTLPVRVQVPEDAELDAWLPALQAQQAAQRQFEFVPLVKIRAWSDVPADGPLFETLLVFENFPRDAFAAVEVPDLRVEGVQYHMTESHAVVLAVAPGAQLALDLKYDRRRIEPSFMRRIVAMLAAAFDLLASGNSVRVADLMRETDRAERERHRADEALTEETAAELLQTVKRAAVRRRVPSEVDDGPGTPTPLA